MTVMSDGSGERDGALRGEQAAGQNQRHSVVISHLICQVSQRIDTASRSACFRVSIHCLQCTGLYPCARSWRFTNVWVTFDPACMQQSQNAK